MFLLTVTATLFFFFNDTATTEIYTLSLHDALPIYDDTTFYGFLAASPAFRSFRHREVFGQVGFGTGGWDTDYPNSMLEILRVVFTAADDDHLSIVGGCQQVPVRLWETEVGSPVHWPAGTSLASLHPGGRPLPAVTRLHRTDPNGITVTDAAGGIRTYRAAVFTAQSWN